MISKPIANWSWRWSRTSKSLAKLPAQIGEDTRNRTPTIPWQKIIAMRNRLVHAYFSINLDIVWQTVQKDLPPLIKILERVAPQD